MLSECFDESVGILNCHTHLKEVLREDFLSDAVSNSLANKEFDKRQHDFGFFLIKVLVATQLAQSVLVIGLACHLLDDLAQDKFELDSTHTIKNGDFR